jgi:hypothetical protein
MPAQVPAEFRSRVPLCLSIQKTACAYQKIGMMASAGTMNPLVNPVHHNGV